MLLGFRHITGYREDYADIKKLYVNISRPQKPAGFYMRESGISDGSLLTWWVSIDGMNTQFVTYEKFYSMGKKTYPINDMMLITLLDVVGIFQKHVFFVKRKKQYGSMANKFFGWCARSVGEDIPPITDFMSVV